MFPGSIRTTADEKLTGGIRLMLAMIFLMTGVMKLVVPSLATAWSGQLLAAELPFYALTRWTIPFVEMGVGGALAAGLFARPASLVVVGIMVPAIYVHMVVDDPSLFPLQPNEPIIPIVVILMAAVVLWRGAGSCSADLKHSDGVE
jgi:uncharacterized membrane protein YphA (DoxX/SURF4 family)